jgi:hypothetical protein
MQKYKWYVLSIIAMIICLGPGTAFGARQSSTNYIIERDVIDGGGGDSSSTKYSLSHVFGQSSPAGASSSDLYPLYAGFLHPTGAPLFPGISVSPSSHDFGSVDVGRNGTQTFMVTNDQAGDLLIGTLSITGADASEFSIKNDDCSGQTLAQSVIGTVDVVLSPQSEGVKSANLSIPSNDPNTPVLNVSLSGKGATPSGGGSSTSRRKSDGCCFIATAAYGSSMDPHVKVLREFRDHILLANTAGRAFVRFYYTYSPPVADFIAGRHTLRALVRWSLLPLVGVSWVALKIGVIPTLALTLMLLAFISTTVVVSYRKKRLQRL